MISHPEDARAAEMTVPEDGEKGHHEHVGSASPEHSQYLMERHGTTELDPLPDSTEDDPLNWPKSKKIVNLLLVAFHAFMGTFTGACIIPAFGNIAEDLHVSIDKVTYLTSLQILVLGVAPLVWSPLSKKYGRRPIFLISLVGSLVCNIGCAKSPTYASMAANRALVAWFISPPLGFGSAVVQETFFKTERGRYMGIWTLLVTVGVPIAPFIFGFVVQRVSYRWIYWVLAIVNGVQLVLYIIFGRETRYIRHGVLSQTIDAPRKKSRFSITAIDPNPLKIQEFIHPFIFFGRLRVLIPAISYAMVFLMGSVLVTVELPVLFIPKFGFQAQAIGLQFLALVIGSVVGEQIGGHLSDYWMKAASKRRGRRPPNEYRLWLSYIGLGLVVCGIVVFLVTTGQLQSYNVSPIVGAGIAAAGNQVVTTVVVTYCVDNYPSQAASIGVFIAFVRQTWAFIGPFWFPPMFKSLGLNASAGLCVGLVVAASILPLAALHFSAQRGPKRTSHSPMCKLSCSFRNSANANDEQEVRERSKALLRH